MSSELISIQFPRLIGGRERIDALLPAELNLGPHTVVVVDLGECRSASPASADQLVLRCAEADVSQLWIERSDGLNDNQFNEFIMEAAVKYQYYDVYLGSYEA